MARIFVEQLKPGQRIDGEVYLVAQKDLRTTSSGSLYIHAVLKDRTGQLLARMWQATEPIFQTLPEGGFARFWGRTESYKGTLQFIIEAIRGADPKQIDIADFLPRTERDVDEMWNRVLDILRKVQDPNLRLLLKHFVTDEELIGRFKRAPAAINMHHAFIGGLLEHTLNVLELALLVVPRYPMLSMDLMLAGIFLHDIGKTAEMEYDTNLAYTDRGQLVGHITDAVIWIHQRAAAVDVETGKPFPPDVLSVLQHIVLAHHGTHEFGSPKIPAVPEAIALHYLDNLDAKVHQFVRQIESDPDVESNWTPYERSLETRLYKKDVLGIRDRKQ